MNDPELKDLFKQYIYTHEPGYRALLEEKMSHESTQSHMTHHNNTVLLQDIVRIIKDCSVSEIILLQ